MKNYKQTQESKLPDISDLPTPRPRKKYDRPFELRCDQDVLDENGDVLVSIHQLPRSVEEGMKIVLAAGVAAVVVDVDRFYGLVAIRPEK